MGATKVHMGLDSGAAPAPAAYAQLTTCVTSLSFFVKFPAELGKAALRHRLSNFRHQVKIVI